MKRRLVSDFQDLSGSFTAGANASLLLLAGSGDEISFPGSVEISWPGPALSVQQRASAAELGPDIDLAGAVPDGSVTYQIAVGVPDGLALEESVGATAGTVLSAFATPGHVSGLPANLTAELAAAHDAGASIGHGDVSEAAPLAEAPQFHTGLHMVISVDSGATVVAEVSGGLVSTSSAALVVVSVDPTDPAPVSFASGAVAVVAHDGVSETSFDHPTSDNGSAAVTPAESTAVLVSLENLTAGSPVANASVGSGGATAAQLRQALNDGGLSVNGSGIKVGVLSDSFNDLGGAAADEADGALPSASNIDVIKDLASGGSDEGRAMMQIIHDIAPGASLAFYTAFDSEQDFANGILALAAAGSKVIVDDVSYFDEPFFQNGVVAQAIQTVEAEGVTYVTAAGNEGSNGYQAAWTPISGTFDGQTLTNAESFGGSLAQSITINTEGTGNDVPLLLEWNQAYGAATSDLEILVFHNGSLVGAATNRSSGEPSNPWVGFDFTATGTYQVAIENLSGPNPGLIKEITEGDGLPATISGANAGTVFGHAMTPGAIAAGAVSAADTPAFGFSSPPSEGFSSSGAGTELLFANNGAALPSPDLLNPVAVSGVDDIATTVSGGLSDFYGTSASSASLAGVAALILSADPNLTPAQVEQIMEETALPMANSAVGGAGLVQVDPAVAAAEAFLTPVVIQTDGSTELVQVGNNYFLYAAGGTSGPELKYFGAPMVINAGQFNGWAAIGAVQTSSGYDVAWKDVATGQYAVWTTDSSGNFTGSTGAVAATSIALEAYETTFHQDLNGDGTVGIVTTLIQTDGSTNLTEVGNNYFLYAVGGTSGPELQYLGAPVAAGGGQLNGWTPIGAVHTSSGYDVAWKDASTGQYSVWTTDGNGIYIGSTGAVAGNSIALETYETTFHQDLNGDGTIGIVATVIQTDGSTSLAQVGSNYFLFAAGGTSGPELQYFGAPMVIGAGQFNGWAAIGAVQTSSGYDVAWKDVATGQYAVWTTDSSGHFVSSTSAIAATDIALETYETTFNQDLNGDGTIGIHATVIQTDGSTSLSQVGSNYFLYAAGGTSGPELKYFGAPMVINAGQFNGWAAIGAVQTSNGYDVAWKDVATGQYAVWTTDSSGNFTGSTGAVAGNSLALEAYEATFHQDLNGDGTIGIVATVFHTNGSSSLAEVGNNYFLFATGGTSGPELQYFGAPVVAGAGQFNGWTPIGAVQTSSGYDVAWKEAGTGQYAVWTTDSSGNFTGTTGAIAGTNIALETYETAFQQDLNGDGTIGIPAVSGSSGALFVSASRSLAVTVMNNDTFVFAPHSGAGEAVSAGGAPMAAQPAWVTAHPSADLFHDAQAGQWQALFHAMGGGHDTIIAPDDHDSAAAAHFHVTDPHAGHFIIS